MPVVEIEGVIQNYAWGSHSAIAEFQGRFPSVDPEAELWLGTHSRGPARIIESPERAPGAAGGAVDLCAFVGGQLPFLFKLLAAAKPLSLQAHPTRAQAEAGFEREERAGTPLDAPQRNYRDRNHKPELICAQTEFHALSGFRSLSESLELLEAMGMRKLLPAFVRALEAGDLESAFRTLFAHQPAKLRNPIQCVLRMPENRRKLPPFAAPVAPWLAWLAQDHPADPGVIAALLLNHVRLEPGEAMYLPAGNLHAYLQGVGWELMASSDNVMRGGLTQKHVDVEELCHILEFTPFLPHVLPGEFEPSGEGVRACVYRTPAEEFEFTRVELTRPGTHEVRGPAILLVESGEVELREVQVSEVELSDGPRHLVLGRGRSAFLAAESSARLAGDGKAAIAALPSL